MPFVSAIGALIWIALNGYAAYLKLRRGPTRAMYALTTTASLLSFTVVGFIAFAGGGLPWDVFFSYVFPSGTIAIVPQEPNAIVGATFVAVLVINALVISRIHKNWDGELTEEQVNKSKSRQDPDLLTEAASEAFRMAKRQPKPKKFVPQNGNGLSIDLPEPRPIVWHQHVRELVELSSRSLTFDQDQGYHDLKSIWIGKNARTSGMVAIFCPRGDDSEFDLGEILEYMISVSTNPIELIYHVIDNDGESLCENVNANPVHVKRLTTGYLLDSLIDFKDYLAELRRRFERESIHGSNQTLNDVYVELHCTTFPNSDIDQDHNISDVFANWIDSKDSRQLAILGDYGMGKSTCSLRYALKRLNSLISGSAKGRIPILMELRGRAPSTLQPTELFAVWCERFDLNPRALMKLHQAGRLALIFEGFDEMAGVSNLESRIAHFRALWKFSHPSAKIAFTGRKNFFLDDGEIKAALGAAIEASDLPHSNVYYLRPLKRCQVEEGLKWVSADVRDNILSAFDKTDQFRDLASRPSLLFIIAGIWHNDPVSMSENISSAFVIRKFINETNDRQIRKADPHSTFMILRAKEREYFTAAVAAFMAEKQLQNQISREDFRIAISLAFTKMPDDSYFPCSAREYEPRIKMESRLEDETDRIAAIETDVRSYGVIVSDVARPGTYKFSHKSFYELIVAEIIIESRLKRAGTFMSNIARTFYINGDVPTKMLEVRDFMVDFVYSEIVRSSDTDPSTKVCAVNTLTSICMLNSNRSTFILFIALNIFLRIVEFIVGRSELSVFARRLLVSTKVIFGITRSNITQENSQPYPITEPSNQTVTQATDAQFSPLFKTVRFILVILSMFMISTLFSWMIIVSGSILLDAFPLFKLNQEIKSIKSLVELIHFLLDRNLFFEFIGPPLVAGGIYGVFMILFMVKLKSIIGWARIWIRSVDRIDPRLTDQIIGRACADLITKQSRQSAPFKAGD
jgi:hypothetical protein